MHVGSTIRLLDEFHAKGELRLVGLQVTGSFDMAGARVESDGFALDLADASIAGNMYVAASAGQRRPEIRGRINLSSTRIDGSSLARAATTLPPEPAPITIRS